MNEKKLTWIRNIESRNYVCKYSKMCLRYLNCKFHYIIMNCKCQNATGGVLAESF